MNGQAKGAPQCKLTEFNGDNTLRVERSGKLAEKDHREFVATVERLIKKHGKIRVLVIHDIQGWTVSALWVDIKFDLKQSRDIERLAIVGKPRWQKGLSGFCKASTSAQIQHFDYSTAGAEQVWFEESRSARRKLELDNYLLQE
jgi:spore germination protein YaaH